MFICLKNVIIILILIFNLIVFSTRVHQTLKDKENPDYVEEHGPFPSLPNGRLYLGNGTYFWDDHLELAHWWGKARHKGKYIICQADLNVKKILFCDLVGCRQDMLHIKRMVGELKISHLNLGTIIEVLKEVENKKRRGDIFPFKVIRAVDDSPTSYERKEIYFTTDKKGYTSLNPVYLICLIGQSDVLLSNYKVIFPEKYVDGD